MLFGQTFTEWTPYDHPQLGEVLIGGGTRWASRTPPPFMLEEECHRNFAFTVFHAEQMPRLAVARHAATRLGPRLWQLDVQIDNSGLIPTRTAHAAANRIGLPDFVETTGEGIRVAAAGLPGRWNDRSMQPIERRPERFPLESGIGGRGSVFLRLLVEGDEGRVATVRYRAEKAADLEIAIPLREPSPQP